MDSDLEEQYDVEIAYVLGPRGKDGAVVVEVLSGDPQRFSTVEQVFVRPKRGRGVLRRVLEVVETTARGHLVIRIEGVETREMADRLRGAALCARAEDSPPLRPGEYYVHQLLGLEVVTTDGQVLGRVEEVIPTSAHDVYVVGEYLIPAVSHVVVDIDLEAGRMTVEPIPGMLDEQ